MEKTSAVDEVEHRLREVLRAAGVDAVTLAVALVSDRAPGLDESLMYFMRRDYMRAKTQQLACRIWCERDRDRDPQPLVDFMGGEVVSAGSSGGRGLFAEIAGMPMVISFEYGPSRLHRLEPVTQYDRILTGTFGAMTRVNAVIGLGDTGDITALGPLLRGLSDAKSTVRAHAADAVRRLANGGAREAVREHDVGRVLMDRLDDADRGVRIAALRALAAAGLVEPVSSFVGRSRRERAEAERVRNGQIPPLEPTWPGDQTTVARADS